MEGCVIIITDYHFKLLGNSLTAIMAILGGGGGDTITLLIIIL